MSIIYLLSSRNYISVNRDLISLFGVDVAVLLGELASEFEYYSKAGALENGCFYSTVENIKTNTGLSEYQQRQAFKVLCESGVVETFKKGIPAKRYIKINEEQVIKLFETQCCKNSSTGGVKIQEQDTQFLSGNKNKEKKINNKHKNNVFIPPIVEDVRAYVQEKKLNVDAQRFVDFYDSNGWMVGRNKMKDWKAACRSWSSRAQAIEQSGKLKRDPSFDIDEIKRKALLEEDYDI